MGLRHDETHASSPLLMAVMINIDYQLEKRYTPNVTGTIP